MSERSSKNLIKKQVPANVSATDSSIHPLGGLSAKLVDCGLVLSTPSSRVGEERTLSAVDCIILNLGKSGALRDPNPEVSNAAQAAISDVDELFRELAGNSRSSELTGK